VLRSSSKEITMHTRTLVAGAAALIAGSAAAGFALFSSHREAPLIADDPTADNTDLYAFVSPESPDRVVMIWNYIPLEEPAGGPNFHKFDDNVRYPVHIDNDHDAKPDITYEFRFTTQVQNPATFLAVTGEVSSLADPDYNVRQFYDVYQILDKPKKPTKLNTAPIPVPPPNVGPISTPNYEASLATPAITTLPNGYRVFAGPRDEAFYVDLGAIFDRLTIRKDFGQNAGGKDGTAGYNVHCCAIEVPIADLTKDKLPKAETSEPILGIYTTASRRTVRVLSKKGTAKHVGGLVQVSRLGSPLVNEVVIPLKDKDKFNASQPKDDAASFLAYVTTPEVPALFNALYGGAGLTTPTTNRSDLVEVFLSGVPGLTKPSTPNAVPSEMLRLNVTIAPKKPGDAGYSRFGVLGGDNSGFPNGRRVNDDVVDIELRALAGVLVGPPYNGFPNNVLGDGVDQNDVVLPDVFPFLATPHGGFTNLHGKPY
jgi:uncharacterized protein DUF4331